MREIAGTRRGDGGNVVGMDEGDSRNEERRWWECGGVRCSCVFP